MSESVRLENSEPKMSAESSSDEVRDLLREAQAVTEETLKEFGQLSGQQVNWKPGADEWSIGQCFDHLITTNETFFPQIDQVIKGEKRQTFWESLPLLPGFWGREIVKRARPGSASKLKAPKAFAPSLSAVDDGIVGKFVAQQSKLIEKLEATKGMDLERIKVTSAVSRVVTYSLLDAYRILVFHERRHFMQAQRVLASAGFPRSAEN